MSIVEFGKHSYNKVHIRLHKWDENTNVRIGSFCSISANCNLVLGGNHRTDWITTYPFGHLPGSIVHTPPQSNGDIRIGNDVWIGINVTIMSGVQIGDGAVIAANSHVVKNVEPYSIVGGNPAKHIRYRFSKEDIDKLLALQWWNWSDELIARSTPILCSGKIDELVEFHSKWVLKCSPQ